MSEEKRIDFLIVDRGMNDAIEFAEKTIKIYRTCVLGKLGMCGDKTGRIKYVNSYLYLKQFIRHNKQWKTR